MLKKSIALGLIVLFASLFPACSSGSSSSGNNGGGSAPAPPPPTLLSIAILPGTSVVVAPGNSTILSCVGSYSNGSSLPVAATWNSLNTSLVSLTGPNNLSSITILGVQPGSTTVQALVGTLTTSVPVTVQQGNVSDPAPVYGLNAAGELYKYPTLTTGGFPTLLGDLGSNPPTGFAIDNSNQNLYFIHEASVKRYSLTGNNLSTIMPVVGNRIALRMDSNGKLLNLDYSSGDIYEIDPAAGTEAVKDFIIGNGLEFDLDISNVLFMAPIISSPDSEWIWRKQLNAGSKTVWGTLPPTAQSINGFCAHSGVAVNRSTGTAYSGTFVDSGIWAYTDNNNDGDALDAGERTLFTDLPIATGNLEHYVSGIAMAAGGSLVVNVNPYTGGGTNGGVYWLKDSNSDGDAMDFNETLLYNGFHVENGSATASLTSPR